MEEVDESSRVAAEHLYISLRKIIDFIELKKLYNRMKNVVAKLLLHNGIIFFFLTC